jgi:hypothetical protein
MPTHFERSYCKSDEFHGKQARRPVQSQDDLTSLVLRWLHRPQQYKTFPTRVDCPFLRENRRQPRAHDEPSFRTGTQLLDAQPSAHLPRTILMSDTLVR